MLNVVNYYERLVIDYLWQMKQDTANSFSQTFLEDVACLALNSLPACYVRNIVDKSAHVTEEEHENMRIKVEKAVAQAMAKVRLHSHEERDG